MYSFIFLNEKVSHAGTRGHVATHVCARELSNRGLIALARRRRPLLSLLHMPVSMIYFRAFKRKINDLVFKFRTC